LPLLTITPDISWKDVSKAYIDECFIRNYRWVIEKWPGKCFLIRSKRLPNIFFLG